MLFQSLKMYEATLTKAKGLVFNAKTARRVSISFM